MRRVTVNLSIALCVAVVALVSAVQAESIGINFAGLNNVTLTADQTAGVTAYEQANWNNAGSSSGSLSSLNSSVGAATTVAASWTAAEAEKDDNNRSTNNHILMNGYIGAVDGSAASVTISGLSSFTGSYQVVLYFDGGGDNRLAQYTLTAGVTTQTVYGLDNGRFGGTFTQVAETSTSNLGSSTPVGNYIVFSNNGANFTSDSFTLSGIGVNGDGVSGILRGPINAIQIVSTIPEPSTFVIAVMGMIGLLAYAWRKRK